MSSLNTVTLIGRLGKDPDVRHTASGEQVANFSLATDEKWTDKNGNKQEHTEWHNITAWSKLADLSSKYLTKGKQVCVLGRLKTREWEDKDGNKRRTTEIVATSIVLLGSKGDGQSQRSSEAVPAKSEADDSGFGNIPDDANIPF